MMLANGISSRSWRDDGDKRVRVVAVVLVVALIIMLELGGRGPCRFLRMVVLVWAALLRPVQEWHVSAIDENGCPRR